MSGFFPKDYIEQHLLDATSLEIPLRYRPAEYRVSGFPYCPILDLQNRLHTPIEEFQYKKEYYTRIGTVLHELLQNSLSNSPLHGHRAYGSWKCSNCGKVKQLCFRPKKCKCHKHFGMWLYTELDFKFRLKKRRGFLSGHLDYLTRDPDKNWVSWEFKTTGGWKISNRDESLPMRQHLLQIQIYNYLLKELYNISVSHYVLIYINRDKPLIDSMKRFRFDWNEDKHNRIKELLDKSSYSHDLVLSLIEKPSKESLKEVVDSRPCYSKKQYLRSMQTRFIYEPCPNFQNGLCAKKEVSKLEKLLWKDVKDKR